MKKISSIFLLVAMLISLLSVPVFADTPTEPKVKPDFADSDQYGGYFVIDEITDFDTELVYDADAGGYIYTPTIWVYVDPAKYYGMNAMTFKVDIASDNIEFGYGNLPDSATMFNYGTKRSPKYKVSTMKTAAGDNALNIFGRPSAAESFTQAQEDGYVFEFTVEFLIKDLELFKKEINEKVLVTFNVAKNGAGNEQWGVRSLDNTQALLYEDGKVPVPKYAYIGSKKDPQPATDPYYTYTGDDTTGYTITFTDAYKNAILNNTDYTSDDGTTTYWKANDPIKNPQYNGKNVSSAANLFSGMALSKVDLTDFNLSDGAMSNMFAGFQGTGNGIPAVGIAANDATAAKYNLTDTGIDKTTLYFGNVTILNYNDGNAYNYVYDDRATTDTDEATTAVTIGNAGNKKQFVNISGKYFAGFENPDKTDALVTIDYSDAVKTKDLDTYLTTNQTSDKNSNVLRLLLNAKDNAPSGVNLSKAMAQKVTKADGTNSIRFIALIDAGYAKYKETGFVLSGVGMNPTRQAGYQYKNTNTIYKKLRALDTTGGKGAVLMDMEKLNGLFSFTGVGFEYTELKIPAGKENTTYYATPYIILEDGTVVYGETKATSFNVLAANDQKSVE